MKSLLRPQCVRKVSGASTACLFEKIQDWYDDLTVLWISNPKSSLFSSALPLNPALRNPGLAVWHIASRHLIWATHGACQVCHFSPTLDNFRPVDYPWDDTTRNLEGKVTTERRCCFWTHGLYRDAPGHHDIMLPAIVFLDIDEVGQSRKFTSTTSIGIWDSSLLTTGYPVVGTWIRPAGSLRNLPADSCSSVWLHGSPGLPSVAGVDQLQSFMELPTTAMRWTRECRWPLQNLWRASGMLWWWPCATRHGSWWGSRYTGFMRCRFSNNSQWPSLKEGSPKQKGIIPHFLGIQCVREQTWDVCLDLLHDWFFTFDAFVSVLPHVLLFEENSWIDVNSQILGFYRSLPLLTMLKLQAASRRQGDAALGLHLAYPCQRATVQGSPVRGTRDTPISWGAEATPVSKLKLDQQQLQSFKRTNHFQIKIQDIKASDCLEQEPKMVFEVVLGSTNLTRSVWVWEGRVTGRFWSFLHHK